MKGLKKSCGRHIDILKNSVTVFVYTNEKIVIVTLCEIQTYRLRTIIRRPASALLDKLLCPPGPGGPAAAGLGTPRAWRAQ